MNMNKKITRKIVRHAAYLFKSCAVTLKKLFRIYLIRVLLNKILIFF